MPIGAGLRQAYELRDAAAREAIALLAVEPPTDAAGRSRRARDVAALLKAWEAASERIRIARGVNRYPAHAAPAHVSQPALPAVALLPIRQSQGNDPTDPTQ